MRRCTTITLLLAFFSLCGICSGQASNARLPQIFVIAVGIDHYEWFLNLHWAVADATSAYTEFTSNDLGNHSVPSGQLLLDKQATRANIIAAFNSVASRSADGDTLIFYFSGHCGTTVDHGRQSSFLLPTDCRTGSLDDVSSTCISIALLRELSSEVAARNQLFVLDTSNGERNKLLEFALTPDTFRASAPTGTDQDPVVRNLLDRNIVIIAPVGMNNERGAHMGTPFNIALRHALEGQADLRGDHRVTARELEAYVPYEMIRGDLKCLAASFDQGDDFVVASVPATSHVPDQRAKQVNPVPTPQPPITKDKDVALLFATDEYESSELPKLNNPVADAQALAAVLRDKYGFETHVEPGLNREEVYTKLAEYRTTLSDNDQLFVFFAGHGLYRKNDGLGYVASKDSKPDDPDPDQAGIDYFKLRAILNRFPCKHVLIALDVCFGGTLDPRIADEPDSDAILSIPGLTTAAFTTDRRRNFYRLASDPVSPLYGTVSDEEYTQRSMLHKSRLFIASGRKESVSDGEPGQHSPFAAALVSVLDDYAQRHTLLTWNLLQDALHHFRRKPYTDPLGSDPDPDFVLLPK